MNRSPMIPDFQWYSTQSKRLGLPPRCPFASAESCPRYYQSLSLLGSAGSTSIAPDEDKRLLDHWKQHLLWPKTAEQATAVSGSDGKAQMFSHFCPEVAYDRFGYFATNLARYADALDQDLAHKRLGERGLSTHDPRWAWASVTPQHYSECPLYSPLTREPPAKSQTKATAQGRLHVYDVFISHASEDKDDFVRPLAAELARLGLRVWFDEWTLKLGDSLRAKIDEGLASSDYGVVVLSRHFFSKNWPQAELDGLFAREMQGRKVILPVWHNVTKDEVLKYSPMLAGKLATQTNKGVNVVANEIYAVVKNVDAPVSSASAVGNKQQELECERPLVDAATRRGRRVFVAATALVAALVVWQEQIGPLIWPHVVASQAEMLVYSHRWVTYDPPPIEEKGYPFLDLRRADKELNWIRQAGFDGIITFSSQKDFSKIPELASERGLAVIAGIWNPTDQLEVASAFAARQYATGYCVGHSGLARILHEGGKVMAVRL